MLRNSYSCCKAHRGDCVFYFSPNSKFPFSHSTRLNDWSLVADWSLFHWIISPLKAPGCLTFPFPRCSAGFLLFLRGFINYARIRKMADTLSTLPRTRVLFIYWAHSRHRHSFPPSQWSVLSGFIQSQREKRRRFPSAWHDLDNTSVFPFWCKKVICCKTIQLLVVYCQVLFAVLKCVMCKWMPYFLFVCLLVAAAWAVLLSATRGQSGLCLLSPLFYQMMSRFSALDSGYFGDYGWFTRCEIIYFMSHFHVLLTFLSLMRHSRRK